MYTKSSMTKLMKNYQFFTFGWSKSLSPAITNIIGHYLFNIWTLTIGGIIDSFPWYVISFIQITQNYIYFPFKGMRYWYYQVEGLFYR